MMFRKDYSTDPKRAQDRAVNTEEHLSKMSPSEIVDEMENIFLGDNSDDMDVDQLLEYLDHLDQVAPIDEPFDAEESYQQFAQNHAALMEAAQTTAPEKSVRRFPNSVRRIILIAATIVLLVGVASIAYASSTPFAQWVNETFSFRDISDQNFSSMREALDAYGVRGQQLPTWLPPEYVVEDVYVSESDTYTTFGALYHSVQNEKFTLVFTIKNYQPDTNTEFEKDGTDVKTVTIGSVTYYIADNNGKVIVMWNGNSSECCISGNFSEEDAYHIINSIE